MLCWLAVRGPLEGEACEFNRCYRYYLDNAKKEREERKSHQQKPSDCGPCQVYRDGHCKNCYNVEGLHCLDGKCVTAEEYARISRAKIRFFVENQERRIANEQRAEQKKEQEEYDRHHKEKPVKRQDTYLPPPTRPPGHNAGTNHPQDNVNIKRSGRLVVKPCGAGRWSCGVCCCPDQDHCQRLPKRLYPGGYGKLPSPDELWDECRNYGCSPPPHEYE